MEEPPKCFNDPIHKHIELHPLLVKFVNTPQFQRLKNIKQLGGNYFLYPGASHNRFEHSIGTSHLAGELVRHLRSNQPELGIDDQDVLCVELAGLCHDLGHGPFSHMFDHHFLKAINKRNKENKKVTSLPKLNFLKEVVPDLEMYGEHEERSCLMFDRILKDERNKDVKEDFEKYLGLCGEISADTESRNIAFIKEMINPKQKSSPKEWVHKGRTREKSFLYEIVANKRNGVDVDKWDYFARDCHQLGIGNSFDHIRFMKNMKVLRRDNQDQKGDGNNAIDHNNQNEDEDKDLQICAREKECKNLYEMFHTRDALHRRAYQHRISTAVEAMICDAMVLANDYIKLEGSGGEEKTMAQSVGDMVAFEKLTDNVIEKILYPSGPNNDEEAQKLLHRVFKHDYYIYIGNKIAPQDIVTLDKNVETKDAGKQIPKTIKERVKEWKEKERKRFEEIFGDQRKNCVYREKTFDYGKKGQNPVDEFLFYSKKDPDIAKPMNKEEEYHMLPRQFMDVRLEVYCKSKNFKEICEEKFKEWIK